MKKFLIGLALLLNAYSFSCEKKMDWIDHYVLAQEAVGIKDGNTAIAEYTKAIELQPDKLFLYVQRAQIYEKKHKWEEAIEDYTYVIEYPNVHPNILLRALYGRGYCYLKIDGVKSYLLDKSETTRTDYDWKRARSMDTSLVHSYENEDYSIIWNVSAGDIHNPEYKKEYSKIMVEIDECQSTNDVKFFDNWTIVKKVKKQKSCCKKCVEKDVNLKKNIQSCVGSGLLLEGALEAKNNNPTDETNCKWWCDRVANSADLMCLEHFKSSKCQYVCMKAVEKRKNGVMAAVQEMDFIKTA